MPVRSINLSPYTTGNTIVRTVPNYTGNITQLYGDTSTSNNETITLLSANSNDKYSNSVSTTFYNDVDANFTALNGILGLGFDTSFLGPAATITSVVLKLKSNGNVLNTLVGLTSNSDGIYVCKFNPSSNTTLTTQDYLNIETLTTRGFISTSTLLNGNLTQGGSTFNIVIDPNVINKTGYSHLACISSMHKEGSISYGEKRFFTTFATQHYPGFYYAALPAYPDAVLEITYSTVITAPAAPTNLSATFDNTTNLVNLSWTAPSDGGSPITKYVIKATPTIGSSVTLNTTSALTTFAFTLGHGTYAFEVAAVNSIDTGPYSSPFTGLLVNPITPPDAPDTLAVTPGNTVVGAIWTAPPYDGGSALTGYHAAIYLLDGTPIFQIGNLDAGTTSYTFSGLVNGTSYYVQVRAKNAIGFGPFIQSSVIVPTTGATVPTAPRNVTLQPGNAQALVSFNVPASDGATPILSYIIKLYGSSTLIATQEVNSATTEYLFTGLENNKTYIATVHAVNGIGAGPETVSNTATTSVTGGTQGAAPPKLTISHNYVSFFDAPVNLSDSTFIYPETVITYENAAIVGTTATYPVSISSSNNKLYLELNVKNVAINQYVTGTVITPTNPGSTRYDYAVTAEIVDAEQKTQETFCVVPHSCAKTLTGSNQLATNDYNTITWTALPGATKYNIYRVLNESTGSNKTVGYIGSTGTDTLTFKDVGYIGDKTFPHLKATFTITPGTYVLMKDVPDATDIITYLNNLFAQTAGFKLVTAGSSPSQLALQYNINNLQEYDELDAFKGEEKTMIFSTTNNTNDAKDTLFGSELLPSSTAYVGIDERLSPPVKIYRVQNHVPTPEWDLTNNKILVESQSVVTVYKERVTSEVA